MRIAVVDDEAAMREQLVSYIVRYQNEYGVALDDLTFDSGDALWSEYKREYDIILFDIDMPGTNGIDTATPARRAS